MEHESQIEEVWKIMAKLRNPISAAKIREHTHLKEKLYNATRWSYTYEMLLRYLENFNYIYCSFL